MSCKSIRDFQMKNLILDIEKQELSDQEKNLIKFVKRQKPSSFVETIRDLYYHNGRKYYDDWLYDDINSRMFWDEIKDNAEQDEMCKKIQLTPDDKEALLFACQGLIGREFFAYTAAWFYHFGFIRSDITTWNCRIFRYLDSYLMTRENIVIGVFAHYEDIRDIEEINKEIMCYLKKNVPSRRVRVLERQIDADERYFETGVKERPTACKEIVDTANMVLKSHAEEIYKIIFK